MQDYFATGSIHIGRCVYVKIVMEIVKNGIYIHALEVTSGTVGEKKEQILQCRGEYQTFGDFLKKVEESSGKPTSKH